ncbi:hypothetical protein [Actinomyces weissii]|uniref:Uncharacterized protein n=1 Tax=Actinomyces weissii TaxID=675090 RepID=A0A7T7MBV6_9ACTO|nr:hypothetical protein [Actinomyces weissii]QQM68485.1 hypothetical protein JG540_07475 [Actinomyces weissii]
MSVVPTAEHRREVTQIGQDFESYRQRFNPECLEEAEAALRGLYELFDVTPVPACLVHDGTSPIVPGLEWHQCCPLSDGGPGYPPHRA